MVMTHIDSVNGHVMSSCPFPSPLNSFCLWIRRDSPTVGAIFSQYDANNASDPFIGWTDATTLSIFDNHALGSINVEVPNVASWLYLCMAQKAPDYWNFYVNSVLVHRHRSTDLYGRFEFNLSLPVQMGRAPYFQGNVCFALCHHCRTRRHERVTNLVAVFGFRCDGGAILRPISQL